MRLEDMKLIRLKAISLLELLLAMGIFVVFMSGGLGFIVTGQKSSLMQSNYSVAGNLTAQGIDVIKFIKKTSWESLIAGNYGINFDGTNWILLPNSDVVDSTYTRVITVQDVYRDDDGNITSDTVNSEIDPNTKKITVTVTWPKGAGVATSENSTYITYWEQDVPTSFGGMMVYADFSGNDDVIKYKLFSASGVWSSEKTVADLGVPDNRDTRRIEIYAAPTRDEYMLMTKHTEDGQFMYAQVFDGSNWGHTVLLAGYGDNTNPNTRNFDGAYLSDGRFLAVYDDFSYTPKYRIWNGSSWSSEGSIGYLGFFGYPVWMQVRAKPNSNKAIYVVRDALQRTVTFEFNGSSWINKITHGNSSSGFSIENISLIWSRYNTNRLGLMFNEANDNNPNIRIWNDSTNSWGSNVENENVGGRAEIFKITDDPTRERFMGCVKDSNVTINCMTTNYTPSWNNSFRIASNTVDNDSRSFDIAYESVSGELALAFYSEGGSDEEKKYPKYRTFNPSTNEWSSEMSLQNLGPDGSNALQTVRLVPNPFNDDIFALMADGSLDLYTILWDGVQNKFSSKPGADLKKHGINGSNKSDFWYAFAWKVYEN